MSIDPLRHKYAGWSSYNYVMGNPLSLIDPDGREVIPTDKFKQSGYYQPYLGLQNNSIFLKYAEPFKGEKRDYVLDYQREPLPSMGVVAGWTDKLVSRRNADGTYAPPTGKSGMYRYTDYFAKYSATNELQRASVVIHELFHAYFKELGSNSPHKTLGTHYGDPEHTFMGTADMIKDMVIALSEYATTQNLLKPNGSKYSEYDFKAIAWEGVRTVAVDQWGALSEEERAKISEAAQNLNLKFEDKTEEYDKLK
jgi:hypothetical protein